MARLDKPSELLAAFQQEKRRPQSIADVGRSLNQFFDSYLHHYPATRYPGGAGWYWPKGSRWFVTLVYNACKKPATPPLHIHKYSCDVVQLRLQIQSVLDNGVLSDADKLSRLQHILCLYTLWRVENSGMVRIEMMGTVFSFCELMLAKMTNATARYPYRSEQYISFDAAAGSDRGTRGGLDTHMRRYMGQLARCGGLDCESAEYKVLKKQLGSRRGETFLSGHMMMVATSGRYLTSPVPEAEAAESKPPPVAAMKAP